MTKIYVVMRDCNYEGDEIYKDKFYLSEEKAEKIANSLIRKKDYGQIIDYYYVKELELEE